MTKKLHEWVAISKGVRERVAEGMKSVCRLLDTERRFDGQTKEYTANDDEDKDCPGDEHTNVELRVSDVLKEARALYATLWNVGASQAYGNTDAVADIVVGEVTVASGVPAVFLLDLERQLQGVLHMIDRMPTLDGARRWDWDGGNMVHVSCASDTQRTRKDQIPIELSAATVEHPAQVQLITRDVVVGRYAITHRSGRISQRAKKDMRARAETLYDAIKQARERANTCEAQEQNFAEPLLQYVFGDA